MRALRSVGVGLLALVVAACQQSKSANPLSPDVAGPIPGVSHHRTEEPRAVRRPADRRARSSR